MLHFVCSNDIMSFNRWPIFKTEITYRTLVNDSSGITSYHSQEIEHYDFRTREYPIPLTTHRNSKQIYKQIKQLQALHSLSGREPVKGVIP